MSATVPRATRSRYGRSGGSARSANPPISRTALRSAHTSRKATPTPAISFPGNAQSGCIGLTMANASGTVSPGR
jgi:hypothetical protein